MKKIIFVTTFIFMLLFSSIALANESNELIVEINDQEIAFNSEPFIENGIAFVEFRPLFEKAKYQVSWDDFSKSIQATKGNRQIILMTNNKISSINGKTISLRVAPRIVDNHLFFPIRDVCESNGAKVKFIDENGIKKITVHCASCSE
ncbi:copper amine oxidase N-terminal domain-containing protein [Inediibacterium massiliense]|uniref:copper amine oxidase N-terminal domain-containing protein n=1 Tax=Inediibacterium massiliense TaxID=1658111 RepID=UPI001FA7EB72|nr:copper amine oxidase N-terminal domain-containing protein [Inediibacterium massiliense]